MYRAILNLALVSVVCAGTIMPYSENKEKQEQPMKQELVVSRPVYSPAQNNNSPSPLYYYPTYPEYTNTGQKIQSGYEGYLVPTTVTTQKNSQWSSTSIASTLLPLSSNLILYSIRAGTYFLQFLLMVIMGGFFTTMICTFTPICSITFLGFGINKNQVKQQVAELARTYITPESVNAATLLVTHAIDKYTALQNEKDEHDAMEGLNDAK